MPSTTGTNAGQTHPDSHMPGFLWQASARGEQELPVKLHTGKRTASGLVMAVVSDAAFRDLPATLQHPRQPLSSSCPQALSSSTLPSSANATHLTLPTLDNPEGHGGLLSLLCI